MEDESCATPVGRREFVRSLVSAFAFAAIPTVQQNALTIGVLSSNLDSGFHDGIRLGMNEVSRAAVLFARRAMVAVNGSDAAQLISRGADVIIGATEADDAEKSARACDSHHVVYLNCGNGSDAFRQKCHPFAFNIEASESMYSDARAHASGARIVLWDSTLERYGAAQLNDRFRSLSGRSMDVKAWCGWFATKIIWESSLRMKGEGSAALRDYLLSDQAQFDGHKGAPLSFRSSDHQLRQPLYAISAGRPPQDVPDLARVEGSIREALDSFGRASAACAVTQ